MSRLEREIVEQLAELAEEERSRRPGDSRLDLETLLDLREGRLSPEAAARARQELMAEPGLVEALQDVDRLEDLEALVQVDHDREQAAWERFEAALPPSTTTQPAEAPKNGAEPPVRWPTLMQRIIARHPLTSLAASFLLAVGLTWQVQQNLPRDSSRHTEYKWIRAEGTESAGPTRSGQTAIELPRTTERIVLFLTPPPALSMTFPYPPEARALLYNDQGQLEPLELEARFLEEQFYLVEIPIGRLPDGDLTLDLLEPSTNEAFATYPLIVAMTGK